MITAASTLRRSDRDPPLANLAEIIKPDAPLRRFKPYPEYKDSGVEWLREIPAHWEAVKLKRACRFAYGDALAADTRQDGNVGPTA